MTSQPRFFKYAASATPLVRLFGSEVGGPCGNYQDPPSWLASINTRNGGDLREAGFAIRSLAAPQTARTRMASRSEASMIDTLKMSTGFGYYSSFQIQRNLTRSFFIILRAASNSPSPLL